MEKRQNHLQPHRSACTANQSQPYRSVCRDKWQRKTFGVADALASATTVVSSSGGAGGQW
jgi:hypothetical protein